MVDFLKRFAADESGVTAIEYAVLAAGVVTVVVAFFASTGGTSLTGVLGTAFGNITTALTPTP